MTTSWLGTVLVYRLTNLLPRAVDVPRGHWKKSGRNIFAWPADVSTYPAAVSLQRNITRRTMVQLKNKLALVLVILQLIFIILFALVVRYADPANAALDQHSRDFVKGGSSSSVLGKYYASK